MPCFGHGTMLPKKPLSYSLGMAKRHSGNIAFPQAQSTPPPLQGMEGPKVQQR